MAKLHADLEAGHAKLRKAAFDAIYGDFSMTTKDVADSLDIDIKSAKILCDELRNANLIVGDEHDGMGTSGEGRKARRFNSLMWQARNTYDSFDEVEHDREYYAAYPNELPQQPKPETASVWVYVRGNNDSRLWLPEQQNIPTAKAEALLEDLVSRGWQAEIRWPTLTK